MRRSLNALFRAVHKASTRRSRISLRSMPARFISNDAGARAWGPSAMPTAAQAASAPLCPFAFITPGAYSGGVKAVSPDICCKAAANRHAETSDRFSHFAQIAKTPPNPFVCGRIACPEFRVETASRDTVAKNATSCGSSEKEGCSDFSLHP